MKAKIEDYRAAIIFDLSEMVNVPNNLGFFETGEAAKDFVKNNLIAINEGATVNRHMDFVEKQFIREDYQDLLENDLPSANKKLKAAQSAFEEAKENLKNANANVNYVIQQAENLALEVKEGLKEIKLDSEFTFKLVAFNKIHYFTYIDKKLIYCKRSDLMDCDKGEIFNQPHINEAFFYSLFKNTPLSISENNE